MNATIVVVDGNIGSGKSELVKNLKKNKSLFNRNIVFLQEPVDEWATIKNNDGTTILELYYSNQKRWSFAFQMMAYISRLALLQKTVNDNPDSIIIMERSMYTDKDVFAKMLYDQGKIHECEMEIYLRWFENFANTYKPSCIVYVDTRPEICDERIKIRNREGENIPMDFLKDCDKYHKYMILEQKQNTVVTINGNVNCYEDNVLDGWIQKIKFHIENIESKKIDMALYVYTSCLIVTVLGYVIFRNY